MAFSHGKNTRVFVDEFNLTTYLNDASTKRDAAPVETTTFGATYKTFIPGFVDGTVSASGLFDGSADAVDEVLAAALGAATNKVVTISREAADAVGDRCEVLSAIETSYEVSAAMDKAVEIKAEFQSDGGLDSGVILHAHEAETTDASETSVDNGAGTSNGGVATLHVTAYSGLDDATVTIEHAPDNSTWATLVTFATVTDLASERVVVAPGTAVDRYLRATVDVTGTGSVTYVVGFARR